MDNEKRTLLAITLSILILFAYQAFFSPPPKKKVQQDNGEKIQQVPSPEIPAPQKKPEPKLAIADEKVSVPVDRSNDVVKVRTSVMNAVMTVYGARFKSVQLHNYKERIARPAIVKLKDRIFSGSQSRSVTADINELKEVLYPDKNAFDLPLQASFITAEGTIYPDSNWTVSKGPTPRDLRFIQKNTDKLTIQKSLHFSDDDYHIDFILKLKNETDRVQDGSGFVEWTAPVPSSKGGGIFNSMAIYNKPRFSYFINNEIEKKELSDIEKEMIIEGDVSWTAVEEKYFTSVIVPVSENPAQVRVSRKNRETVCYKLIYPYTALNPGDEKTYTFSLYIGPKDIDILRQQNALLEKTIDFGWFDIIAKPLLLSLKFFYSFTHNYGVAIILITIIIKILFWPLANKSFKSMKGMQSIQPEIAKLKEKYGDNREEFAKQQMALYKQYNVNPLGGCLPMLLQIPVFIALYRVLADSIELRHANFIAFWINDLSAKDPTYIAPLLMGASMFFQQKMTPSTADPTQAKMMMFMPLIFTVMFLSFPSGLVIYWLLNNVLSIAQQLYINKKLNVPGGNECSPSKPKPKQSKKQ